MTVLVIIMIIFMLIFMLLIRRDKIKNELKQSILLKVLPNIFENSSISVSPKGITSGEFNDSRLYTRYNKFVSSDKVTINNGEIQFSNIKADEEMDSSTIKNTFKGILIIQRLNDIYENEILIKPDVENKLLTTIKDQANKMMNNMQNVVRLENHEFENYFEVISKDQNRARQVVTIEYMEDLVELREKLKAPIKIRYFGNRKYIAIWNHRVIDEKKLGKVDANILKEDLQLIKEVIEKC